MFPVGGLLKPEVRRIAEEQGLATAKRKDSQGICFVGKVDLPTFLQQKLAPKKGNIHEILPAWPKYVREEVPAEGEPTTGQLAALAEPWRYTVRDGKKIGEHGGAHFYTIGQRKGLGLAMGAPVYVCGKDMQANTVTVGPEEMLFDRIVYADEVNWIAIPELTGPLRVTARTRYHQVEQAATVYPAECGFRLEFDQPQRAPTPGQAVVLYQGDTVLGGGTITRVEK